MATEARADELRRRIAEDAELTEKWLRELFPSYSDKDVAFVNEAEKYSLLAGGKRIRPFLVIEFCRLFGGKISDCAGPAAAVELMHTFSLIHDDLPCMDDDELRRGRPTCHVRFGEAAALLAGDALSIRAFEALLSSGLDSDRKVRAASELALAAGDRGMIAGQIADMRGETERLSFDELVGMESLKTGKMIILSAKLGCIAAGLPEGDGRIRDAEEFSSRVGRVFQVVDDILDVSATPGQIGKSTGGDAEHGKSTFMTYMTPDAAFGYASRLTEEAKGFIGGYPGSEILCDFADYLLTRKK